MRRLATLLLATLTLIATRSNAAAGDRKELAEVSGRVLVLKEGAPEKAGTINPGGLIVLEIHDSGSRPPQDIKVDGGKSIPLGHVRGVATNAEGRAMMGGGYIWYLFKAPADSPTAEIDASYTPNGQDTPKPTKRHYLVQLDKQG